MKRVEISGRIPEGFHSYFIVDDEDYKKVSSKRWYYYKFPQKRTYSIIHHKTKQAKTVSKYILDIYQTDKRSILITHKNGDMCDCRKKNLIVTFPTSKYKGIVFSKKRKQWVIYLYLQAKRLSFGNFQSEQEALKIRDAIMYNLFKNEKLLFNKKYKNEQLPERIQYRLQMIKSEGDFQSF